MNFEQAQYEYDNRLPEDVVGPEEEDDEVEIDPYEPYNFED